MNIQINYFNNGILIEKELKQEKSSERLILCKLHSIITEKKLKFKNAHAIQIDLDNNKIIKKIKLPYNIN